MFGTRGSAPPAPRSTPGPRRGAWTRAVPGRGVVVLTWPPSVHLSQGLNGQKKYQINLKSHAGPIHVLLINKEASSAKPVAFPVPPPDDLTQPPAPTPAPVPSPPGPLFCERSQSLQQTVAGDMSSGGSRASFDGHPGGARTEWTSRGAPLNSLVVL